jgi:hypothetical protein
MIFEAIASVMLFGVLFIVMAGLMVDTCTKYTGYSEEQLKAVIPPVTYYSYPILLILMGIGFVLSVLWVVLAVYTTIFGA